MTNIPLNEPGKLADLDLERASEYINGAAYMVCPDDSGISKFYPLRARIEDAHDLFMGLMEQYDHMKNTGASEEAIAASIGIRNGASDLIEALHSVAETAHNVGVPYFDERCGNAGVQAGFAILGMWAILDSRKGVCDALRALGKPKAMGPTALFPKYSKD